MEMVGRGERTAELALQLAVPERDAFPNPSVLHSFTTHFHIPAVSV